MRKLTLLFLAAASLAGCGFVPKDGPTGYEILTKSDVTVPGTYPSLSYAVVNLSPLILDVVERDTIARTPRFTHLSGDSRSGTDVRFQVGDILALTIFEAQAGGLFIPNEAGSRAGNFVQIPNQQVDESGSINVPYAGTINVIGKTARAVSAEITDRLKNRAIEPQVVVSIVERRSSQVSVLGDVNAPARFPLDPGGTHLLGAIARAGGPKSPPFETIVTLQRRGMTQQASLSTIVKDPRQNFNVQPGDVIFLHRDPRVFMVLGATLSPGSIGGTNNRRFSFDNDNMTLAEGISKAGGLDTARSEAKAVFLFRFENKQILANASVDVSRYDAGRVPTVYVLDLSRAEGLFLSNHFFLQNEDIIYVSESPSNDVVKFFTVVQSVLGPGYSAAGAISGFTAAGIR